MARLAAGQDRALDELMDRWSAKLVAFLLRLTGNHATACDLAHETIVRLHHTRGRFRPGRTSGPFLFQIAANLAKNHARWRHRHPEVPMDGESPPEAAADEHAAPDRKAEAGETAAAVRAAVLALPDDLRQPLVLSVYEGKEQEEIAAILGCTRKAVEMRIYRARQLLRARLAAFMPD